MREQQDKLRDKAKELKWKKGINYKELAEMLDMKYNSFVNFIHGYKDLGYERAVKLQGIIREQEKENE